MECSKTVIFQWTHIFIGNSNCEEIILFYKILTRHDNSTSDGKVIWEGVWIDSFIREQEVSSSRFQFRVLKICAVDAFVYESVEYPPQSFREDETCPFLTILMLISSRSQLEYWKKHYTLGLEIYQKRTRINWKR